MRSSGDHISVSASAGSTARAWLRLRLRPQRVQQRQWLRMTPRQAQLRRPLASNHGRPLALPRIRSLRGRQRRRAQRRPARAWVCAAGQSLRESKNGCPARLQAREGEAGQSATAAVSTRAAGASSTAPPPPPPAARPSGPGGRRQRRQQEHAAPAVQPQPPAAHTVPARTRAGVGVQAGVVPPLLALPASRQGRVAKRARVLGGAGSTSDGGGSSQGRASASSRPACCLPLRSRASAPALELLLGQLPVRQRAHPQRLHARRQPAVDQPDQLLQEERATA